jgi:hypothetical protein
MRIARHRARSSMRRGIRRFWAISETIRRRQVQEQHKNVLYPLFLFVPTAQNGLRANWLKEIVGTRRLELLTSTVSNRGAAARQCACRFNEETTEAFEEELVYRPGNAGLERFLQFCFELYGRCFRFVVPPRCFANTTSRPLTVP